MSHLPSGGQAMGYGASETDAGNSLKEALSDLKNGKVSSCYLLYGEEEFLIRDSLEKIISLILPDSDRDLNLFYVDGEQEDIEGLCQSLQTPPLIAGAKIVVLKNTRIFHSASVSPDLIRNIRDHMKSDHVRAAKDFIHFLRLAGWSLEDLKDGGWKSIRDDDWQKAAGDGGRDREVWLPQMIEICLKLGLKEKSGVDGAERLMEILKMGIPEGNHLILTAGAVDKRKKIFKSISETGTVLHFPQIKIENRKRQALMDIARSILAEAGKTVTPGAWAAIGKKTGYTVESSVEAIEKLITYTGKKALIEENDVEEVIGKTKEGTIFDLTNAISEKKLKPALAALKDLFDQGTHELLILTMVSREIRLLLHAGMVIRSGKLGAFDKGLDYARFQKSVYPVIRSWAGDADKSDKKESAGEFVRQHPFVMYHALKYSQGFSFDALVGYLEELVNMDVAFKSTTKDPRFMLERFFMKVCSGV
jgi:DNA polymerase III subunit delta